ncbi:NAD(P)-dependent oxidoreductase [Oscillibacter sp.]|uniref:2-hydroxyacid dehydrogenase n=1 Tax=Oscillibacter sp. TaxID=1945593 RepID=UPI0028B17C4D|nr:NAD(P)-dependent oxidoreductase [Oscillibacter sp.]
MKVLVLAPQSRYDAFGSDLPGAKSAKQIFCDREGTEAEWLAAASDADALFVTPVTPVSAELISNMPNLKLIHSEGVGFDRIDLDAARARGIYVCNCAGCNAAAVSELSVTLMGMLLHRVLWGNRMVRAGKQGEAVRLVERDVPADLSVSTVGLVGFGAIGQAVAERLRPFGATVYYYAPHRRDTETETQLNARYLPLEELAAVSDIISLHLPSNDQSRGLINREFLARMKPTACLVNTARGAIIDDEALCNALREGKLAGVALDCYEPEPAGRDHPLVRLAAEFPDRLILCPHYGGVAQSAFRAAHRMLFEDLESVRSGRRPKRVVNGL